MLALVRGPGSSPHEHGVEGALDRIEALLIEAGADGPVAYAELLLAGVDFPAEVETVQRRARERGWAERVEVANDTFAVLRAGTDRGWGVAVVCGAGINCLGLAPDGRQVRFPALGAITGDWGGGQDVGGAAVWAAARSEDGRGPRTTLEQLVPAHFGLDDAARARGGGAHRRDLATPLRRARADRAREARRTRSPPGIVERLADEVVSLVRVSLERIGTVDEPADVVLGGGLMQARDARLLDGSSAGSRELGAAAHALVVDAPPVVGAALRALDDARRGARRARAAAHALNRRASGGSVHG